MPTVSNRAIFTVYFIVFVDFFQIGFVWPLLPKIVEAFGGGATQIGILGSVSAAGEGFAAPYLGNLADRIGRRPVFLIAMLGCLLSCVLTAYTEQIGHLFSSDDTVAYYFLVFARLLTGVCGGTASVAGAYIADVTSEEERPRYMTWFQAAIFGGLTFGPVLGGLMDGAGGFEAACLAAAGVCALNLLCTYFMLPESRVPSGDGNAQDEARDSPPFTLSAWMIFFAAFFNGVGFVAFEALGTLYLQDSFFDGDPAPATFFWSEVVSGVGVVGLVTNLALYEPIQKRTGLKGSIMLGGICCVVSFWMLGLPVNKWWFFWFTQLLVFGDNIMGTTVQTLLTCVVHPSQFGKAMGMMTLFQNIARALGPFVFGPVYEHIGRDIPWFANAALKGVAIILCVMAPAKKPALADAEGGQEDASPEAVKTPTAAMTVALTRQSSGTFRAPGGLGRAEIIAAHHQAARPALNRNWSWSAGQAQAREVVPVPPRLQRGMSST
eukprot:TRINITY_DN80417_c0_g1_i1.p1 TRINITY_DN80417_c0_g1~~TRINITY_DN80417_c0_g1_i1.p1  ORF type:complete len:493 (+),score=55.56 TRINITY_DN80417_c0_g1_i1:86-1564(+)